MTHRFFGYGSLVNLSTHDYPGARPARLSGWRRVWRHAQLRPVAFLSVERAEDSEIEGVVADVPGADWRALDERERAYARRDVTELVRHDGEIGPTVVYEIESDKLEPPDVSHPILLSYIDVVVQGYLRLFGQDGVDRFVASTRGWDAPVLDDREAPIYPRPQLLSPDERRKVDRILDETGARVAGPEAYDLSRLGAA
ncbi:gamma-glutamylcyclotransferase family protein [Histidinibacterium aquaticum]|uniref:Gamma-glutamylcyclotransferase n=1 Tax=Histidinibacterium aquaticum TaxID=2613962 RepID=A0A5J5GNY3_9RHOB|nr:gamma-glutamylcyclotransferase family protein [Histidinibacterium aquaticum]KAA9010071.1 gamma-glutamylcyclotransferase [Histidinibacterium aquaticum]